jgi:hypothetical protein
MACGDLNILPTSVAIDGLCFWSRPIVQADWGSVDGHSLDEPSDNGLKLSADLLADGSP